MTIAPLTEALGVQAKYQGRLLATKQVLSDLIRSKNDLLYALKDLVEQDEANRPDGGLLDCGRAYELIKKAAREEKEIKSKLESLNG